jgi:hypothetical protein
MTHPLTRAESSRWRETSLSSDVMDFVRGLAARRDPRFALAQFGVSPEGRELPLCVLAQAPVTQPWHAHRAGNPVVLVLNGIHAGEVEGKEASLALMRDLLDGQHAQILEGLVLLCVPLFNPDGNDRIDPANRALDLARLEGQIGPEAGVGTRANASGVNLNRDYMAQSQPEMRLLMERVWRRWRPHLTIDCHATNGSVHRFAVTYDVPHTVESGRREPIEWMRTQCLPEVTRRLARRTGIESFFYGNFVEDETGRIGAGPGEGWRTYTHHPRFGGNYRGLTNRLDLLIETYSYLPFEQRVRSTYEFLVEALTFVAERARDAVQVVESSQDPPRRVAVRYALEAFPDAVEILTRSPRTLDGAPTSVRIPHFARFVGSEVVERPWAYAVPPQVAQHLERHGLFVRRLRGGTALVEGARVEGAAERGARKILEAAAERELAVSWWREELHLAEGTWIVETEQPLGAIAVYLCEPRSDDSVLTCGVVGEPAPGDDWPCLRVLEPIAI